MLDIPGLLERDRLPKAVAVSKALKNTARVRGDWRNSIADDGQIFSRRYCRAEEFAEHRDRFVRGDAKNAAAYAGRAARG
jgi:hypothetical protein